MSAVDRFDPEILALFTAAASSTTESPEFIMPERGDAMGLRSVIDAGLAVIPRPVVAGVSGDPHRAERRDGAGMELRWYSRDDDDREDRAAIVYFHGGGRVAGKIDHYDGVIRHYVQETNVPMLLVDYGLAPEYTGTSAQEDGLAGLEWLINHATDLRVDPARIGVMGDSAGGGVAAGTAILARDKGVGVAKQILIYPMLDDRTTVPDPALDGLATWTPDTNWTGWHAVLGDSIGGGNVSPVAAPARLEDFSGLPPAYIEVGDLDIFRDESISYAQRLHHAGIPCELHVNAGVIHGHDLMSFDMQVTRRTIADRCRAISTL
ncbi:alpha/beta hydrolase [Arthrobacter sp. AK01]|uniref:alpha/beta hydrolase n=1 Tax=Micrococcaceae TaxID=1268 RepID=UPI001E62EF23|nr:MULTISPECIES: alpha/beta hydrolase [Micrococcaceae]MCD4853418.1 alpha/beta hydrolase [Arthrobacter sp. AK01]MCP1413778.1 acetyl esterase/lipase [Paenarthrobacter sp. A20]